MTTTTITFDRIGRNHSVPPLVIDGDPDGQDVADAVYKYARKFLMSSDYEVTANLQTGRVSIDYGRFGEGTITTKEQA